MDAINAIVGAIKVLVSLDTSPVSGLFGTLRIELLVLLLLPLEPEPGVEDIMGSNNSPIVLDKPYSVNQILPVLSVVIPSGDADDDKLYSVIMPLVVISAILFDSFSVNQRSLLLPGVI